jgi:hypothetical protein
MWQASQNTLGSGRIILLLILLTQMRTITIHSHGHGNGIILLTPTNREMSSSDLWTPTDREMSEKRDLWTPTNREMSKKRDLWTPTQREMFQKSQKSQTRSHGHYVIGGWKNLVVSIISLPLLMFGCQRSTIFVTSLLSRRFHTTSQHYQQ